MLHVFVAFSDISLAELQHAAAAAGQHHHGSNSGGAAAAGGLGSGSGASDAALTPRLRATLLRVAGDSIGKYCQLFAAQPGSKLARALEPPAAIGSAAGAGAAGAAGAKPPPAPSSSSSSGGASQYFRRTLPGSAASSPGPAAGVGHAVAAGPAAASSIAASAAGLPGAAAAAASVAPIAEISVVSNAGNLYGLLERTTAAESLLAVAAQLYSARGALAHALPPTEAPALDAFLSRTVGAAEDLRDLVIRAGEEGRGAAGSRAGSPSRCELAGAGAEDSQGLLEGHMVKKHQHLAEQSSSGGEWVLTC